MNPIQLFEYGKSRGVAIIPNTFIGGIASTLNSKEALAIKLNISSSNISYFAVIGSDIEAKIDVDCYVDFTNDVNITYYKETEGRLIEDPSINLSLFTGASIKVIKCLKWLSILTECFRYSGLKQGLFYGATIISYRTFTDTTTSLLYFPELLEIKGPAGIERVLGACSAIFMPKCTILGTNSSTNQTIFGDCPIGVKIWAHPSLQTSNGGAENADLAWARANKAAIIDYSQVEPVNLFTIPNPVTDLAVGTVHGSAVQLNFTVPTGSANAISFYELYVNGVYKKKIISGEYATGLNLDTTYNFEVKPADIYYNKSTSNVISQKTAITYVVDTTNLVSSWKLDGNALDSKGTNNGTATAITYEAGMVGQRAIFNGTTSKIDCGNAANLQINTASMVVIVKTSNIGSAYRGILSKNTAYSILTSQGVLGTYSFGGGGFKSTGININDGLDHIIIMTFQSGVTNGTKIYMDGKLVLSTTIIISNQSSNLFIGQNAATQESAGKIDEADFFNIILNEEQISEITAKLNSGQSLI